MFVPGVIWLYRDLQSASIGDLLCIELGDDIASVKSALTLQVNLERSGRRWRRRLPAG